MASGANTARSTTSPRPETKTLSRSRSEGSWTVSALLKQLPESSFVAAGPGDYDADRLPPKHRAPAFTMPKTPRTDLMSSESIPGPGAYKVEQALDRLKSHGPVVAIPNARNDSVFHPSDAPGPGAYTPSKPLSKSPSAVIPSASRDGPTRPSAFAQSSIAPGPGLYDVAAADRDVRQATPGQTMAKASYSPRKERETVPGPGAYDLTHAKEKHSFHATMSGTKLAKSPSQETPGPGAYEVKKPMRRSRSAVISSPSTYVHRNAGLRPEDLVRDLERARTDRLIGLSRESSRVSATTVGSV